MAGIHATPIPNAVQNPCTVGHSCIPNSWKVEQEDQNSGPPRLLTSPKQSIDKRVGEMAQ